MPIAVEGYFLDGKSLPYCDFDHPWWIADMYDRFSCAGKLYGFIGDASLSLYKDMTVIYFNKRLWDENKAPNPYDLVRNNEWTLDKFITLCSGMQRDLNGDGTYDETDQLTFLGEYVPCGTFQTSLQLDVVRIGSDGTPEYLGLTEKFLSAFEKLQTFHAGEGVMRMSSIDDKSYKSMITFGNGNVDNVQLHLLDRISARHEGRLRNPPDAEIRRKSGKICLPARNLDRDALCPDYHQGHRAYLEGHGGALLLHKSDGCAEVL